MSFITENQAEGLKIDKFIFHVVHHGEEDAILLEETPIGEYQNFFVGRIKEILKGNRFVFRNDSNTETLLKQIEKDSSTFVENSQKLAKDFHRFYDKRVKPGVLICMVITARHERLFSLIKFDHEEVLTYEVENRKAVLEAITNSITKSAESLQKSALIRLKENGQGDVLVVDRKVSYDISNFFKGFLDVKRKYHTGEMTEKIQKITIQTAQEHKNLLPEHLISRIRQISYDTILSSDNFIPDEYFNKIFSGYGNSKVKETFNKLLEKNDLDGESFPFDKNSINQPKKRKYKTQEGVTIEYPKSAEKNVDIKVGDDEEMTEVTIRTQKLSEL